jgi:hypothetical protein
MLAVISSVFPVFVLKEDDISSGLHFKGIDRALVIVALGYVPMAGGQLRGDDAVDVQASIRLDECLRELPRLFPVDDESASENSSSIDGKDDPGRLGFLAASGEGTTG